ncbi:adhesion G-protein coupled receptor G2 [Strongylocentrotus purpuratus]|uniref:Uncharacterized protein n=1 Tax=Strongylocentrotus purpuratus TaxID=7668 RepID=A0A7M7HPX3_STRPU|nr:adhesion G-protein coupled receptor G2 [Strongylocentrotus purpuratus]
MASRIRNLLFSEMTIMIAILILSCEVTNAVTSAGAATMDTTDSETTQDLVVTTIYGSQTDTTTDIVSANELSNSQTLSRIGTSPLVSQDMETTEETTRDTGNFTDSNLTAASTTDQTSTTDFVTNVTLNSSDVTTTMDAVTDATTGIGIINSTDFITEFVNVTEIVTYFETVTDDVNNTDTTTNIATNIGTIDATQFITDIGTVYATEIMTEVVTEIETEIVTKIDINATEVATDGGTINVTDFVTDFITEIHTINVTELVTEETTEFSTIDATENVTRIATTNVTDIVTEIVTVNATEVITSSLPNETDYATELTTLVDPVSTDASMTTLDETTHQNPIITRITMVTDAIMTSLTTLFATDHPTLETSEAMSTEDTTSSKSTPAKGTTLFPTTTTTDPTTTQLFSTVITTASASTPAKETTPMLTTPSTTTKIESTSVIRMTTERRNIDDDLKELEETPVTEENVEEISKDLAELTEDSEDMTSDGVETTAEILGNITALNSSEPEVTTAVVETVNNLMNVDEAQLEAAANEGATNMAVQSLESQLQFVNVSASNGTYTDVQPNLGVQVSEYPPEELTEGLTFVYATNDPSGELLPEHMIVYKGKNDSSSTTMETNPVQAQLFLPPSIGKAIRGNNNTRVSFVLYRTTSLFPSRSLLASNKGKPYNRTSNTRIISASIGGIKITNLSEPVLTSYMPITVTNDTNTYNETLVDVTNPVCVFWDFDADDGYGNWSTDGCQLVGMDNDTGDELLCQCNHLTNFAVLMDIYGGSTLDDKWTYILDVLSYAGCSLSIFFLFVTIVTFLSVRKLRNPQPSRILMCLCISLLCLYIFFIILASLKTVTMTTCGIIVGFLHFSLLSSIAWMAVESFNMYLMVIKIFDRGGIRNFMIKAAVFTLGVPAVIVGLTGGIAQRGYMRYNDGICGFLAEIPMIGGVLVPIATVIIYDSIIFVMVIRRLSRKVEGRQLTKPIYKERIRRLQNASALIILMGLTWAIGFFTAIEGASVSIQIIFIILNSLQGFFLFLFYCLRNPAARSQWRKILCCCLPPVEETTSMGNSTQSRSRSTTDDQDKPEKKWYHVLMGKTGSYDLSSGWRKRTTSSTFELSAESTTTSKEQSYRHNDDDDDVDVRQNTFDDDEDGIEDGVETTFGHSEADRL